MPQFSITMTVRVDVGANDADDAEATIDACLERVSGVMLDDGTVATFAAPEFTHHHPSES